MTRTSGWLGIAFLVAVGLLPVPSALAAKRLVLLDEYWLPEIMQNQVRVTEVDTEKTGGPTEAVAGYFSARLENDSGWPSVRFRNMGSYRREELPPDAIEGRLWYRTDRWAGKWALEVWTHSPTAGRPVKMLEGELDGGGEGGTLIGDDRWHQARGRLAKGAEYDMVATDGNPRACYVWLRPLDGWDVPHRTYVDRIEAVIGEGPADSERAVLPVRHVRPVPGAQVSAPGWVRWEAEDALSEPEPAWDSYAPRNAEAQGLLSNGRWVLKAGKTNPQPLSYEVEVPEAGTYALWARGYWPRGAFRWRWDESEWSTSAPGILGTSPRAPLNITWLLVGWAYLGEVELSAGTHTFTVESVDMPEGHAFDCWVLARDAFGPMATGSAPSAQE
jgi:hypothetical protein